MIRLGVLCIHIPIRTFVLGVILGMGAFIIFEAYVPKHNPKYDGWDAWFLYWIIVGFSLLFSCALSFLAFLNLSKRVRDDAKLNKATFIVPIFPLILPAFLILFSTVYIIYLIVPICISILQYYHYWRFAKNMRAGVYVKEERDENN